MGNNSNKNKLSTIHINSTTICIHVEILFLDSAPIFFIVQKFEILKDMYTVCGTHDEEKFAANGKSEREMENS